MLNYDTPIADMLELHEGGVRYGGIFVLERPLDFRSASEDTLITNSSLHLPVPVMILAFSPEDESVTIGLVENDIHPSYSQVSLN